MQQRRAFLALLLLLLIVAAATSLEVAADRPLIREFLDDPSAVCNDGTRGAYFIRKSNSADASRSNRWVIYLNGGFWCWDKTTCDRRWNQSRWYMTSNLTTEQVDSPAGIFSESKNDNPDFWDANVVTVLYCSSDTYSGSDAQGKSELGWYFRGKVIISAVIKQLQQRYGLGMRPNSTVLFTGASAGGAGVINNADFVAKLLRVDDETLGIDYRVLIDSGIFGHVPVLNPVMVANHEQQFRAGLVLWRGVPNENCRRQLVNEQWKCYMGDYVLQYIDSPMLAFQFTTDSWVVNWGLQETGAPVDPKHNETQKAYAELVARNALETLRKVFVDGKSVRPLKNGKVISLGFAPVCYWHTVLATNEEFAQVKLTQSKLSMRNLLNRWLNDKDFYSAGTTTSKGLLYAETCTELSCSIGCRN